MEKTAFMNNDGKRMIIFDLDGTLWDSAATVAEAWNMAIKEMKGDDAGITADDIRRNMGRTMDEVADDVIPGYEPQERYELCRRCGTFENGYIREHGGMLYPEVESTLERLSSEGFAMSIVSNCQEGYVPAFIEAMKMDRFFADYEEWGRSGRLKADNIRLVMERNGTDKAIYVGDIQNDANAAAEAGIPCIWASYGFGRIEEPAGVLSSFDELPELLVNIEF